MLKNSFKLALVLTLILASSSALANWTAPPQGDPGYCPINDPAYPACNPPINTSITGQVKQGGLIVGGLGSLGNIMLKTTQTGIVSDTLDGADDKFIGIGGGGLINDSTRGASISLMGNEFTFLGLGGSMLLKTGGVGDIMFQTGTTPAERMRITDTGNISIGSNGSPQAPLHLKVEPVGGLPGWIGQVLIEPVLTNNDAGITLKTARAGTTQLWSILAGNGIGNNNFRIFSGNGTGDAIDVKPNGDVGIGVVAPASKLDVNGNICWVPPGGTRQCLGSGGGGTSYWATNAAGDIRNTNTDAGGLPAQVNIQGQVKIEGGSPGANKILASNANGLASWKTAGEVGAGGIGSDVLFTTFSGCVPGLGCVIRSGDAGPTQSHSILGGIGTVTMTCPAGYNVVSGGVDCDDSYNLIVAMQSAYINANKPISKTQWQVQCTKLLGVTVLALFTTKDASAIRNASIICAR